jgi:anti-anti-sigma regulatory factor
MTSKTCRPAGDQRPDGDVAVWGGDITWRDVAERREALFDCLEAADSVGVTLDVRDVTSIDRTGVALLIGVNHRAHATGRRLVILDCNGPVTSALARMHLLGSFVVTQAPVAVGSAECMTSTVTV